MSAESQFLKDPSGHKKKMARVFSEVGKPGVCTDARTPAERTVRTFKPVSSGTPAQPPSLPPSPAPPPPPIPTPPPPSQNMLVNVVAR